MKAKTVGWACSLQDDYVSQSAICSRSADKGTMEGSMTMHQSLVRDLGMQHALENVLSVLREDKVEANNRVHVIDVMIDFLDEANYGSNILATNGLAVNSVESPAIHTFSIISKCLDNDVSDVSKLLSDAKRVMNEFKMGQSSSIQERAGVESLFEKILQFLNSERNLAPLARNQEYSYL